MVTVSLYTVVVVAVIWLSVCNFLRSRNFDKSGKRTSRKHAVDEEIVTDVVRYQNEAIYRGFEFFFKISLATLGGVAYISLTATPLEADRAMILIYAGSAIVFAAATTFSATIVMHQKSKIERWENRYRWYEPLFWVEFPLIAVMIAVAVVFGSVVTPFLVEALAAT